MPRISFEAVLWHAFAAEIAAKLLIIDAEPIYDWRTTVVNNNFGTRFKKSPVLKATIELANTASCR